MLKGAARQIMIFMIVLSTLFACLFLKPAGFSCSYVEQSKKINA